MSPKVLICATLGGVARSAAGYVGSASAAVGQECGPRGKAITVLAMLFLSEIVTVGGGSIEQWPAHTR